MKELEIKIKEIDRQIDRQARDYFKIVIKIYDQMKE